MEDIAARRVAEALLAEHKANVRFRTLAPPDGPASISDAYDIQEKYVALLRGAHGEAVGYKVGLTSATMQKFCGIDHPIAGVVLASRVHKSGATRAAGRISGGWGWSSRSRFASSRTCRSQAGHARAETIAPHIDGVCAAIEIVDDRSADYGSLDVRSLVADNSWNAGIVLSEFSTKWPDLEAVRGRATNGRRRGRRRFWARYSRPSLQFGRMAGDAARFARRRVEGGPGGDDRERDEDGISGGRRKLSIRACRDWIGRGAGAVIVGWVERLAYPVHRQLTVEAKPIATTRK